MLRRVRWSGRENSGSRYSRSLQHSPGRVLTAEGGRYRDGREEAGRVLILLLFDRLRANGRESFANGQRWFSRTADLERRIRDFENGAEHSYLSVRAELVEAQLRE